MDLWIHHTILLCVPLCLALVQNQGPNALSDETVHIFPQNKVFERGSNITFCCIAKKNNYVTSFTFYKDFGFVETQQQRALFTRTPASSFPGRFQFSCAFSNSDNSRVTYLYLTKQPDKPQNLSCEIKDMIYIKCTWDPEYVEMAFYLEEVCPMEFILSDISSRRRYCSTKTKNTCSFKMGDQSLYNVRLTSRNCLGQKHEQLHFDVNYRGGLSTNS